MHLLCSDQANKNIDLLFKNLVMSIFSFTHSYIKYIFTYIFTYANIHTNMCNKEKLNKIGLNPYYYNY